MKKILSHQKWRPFWIFEFFAKIAKHKNAYISKTLLDRAISTKFLTHRVYLQSSHANFQKILSRQKWRPFWIFEFFEKIAKHKNAYISKTLLDRAISTKFLTHRVSLKSSHANFQTKNFSQKMAAILNFRIFRKIAKHKNAYISKTVLDRAISTKFLTHRVSMESSHANFQKNFVLPKMAAILNFRIFVQKLQNTKMLIFRKPCYIERFRQNFLSSGYLCRAAIPKSFHLVKFQTHS